MRCACGIPTCSATMQGSRAPPIDGSMLGCCDRALHLGREAIHAVQKGGERVASAFGCPAFFECAPAGSKGRSMCRVALMTRPLGQRGVGFGYAADRPSETEADKNRNRFVEKAMRH